MFILILAGGRGTRLWPVSRKNKPKQISEIFSTDTMIQKTWTRLRASYDAKNIFISTDKQSAAFIKKQLKNLPKDNLIIEPLQRGTAAAIGYGASYIYVRHGNVPLVVLSSDAHVENEQEYLRTLKYIETVLKKQPRSTVLLGVKPTYAETGYGYIKTRNPRHELVERTKPKPQNTNLFPERSRRVHFSIHEVDRFIEKPSLEKAREYVKSGNYLWNPGIFGWNIEHLAELYKKYLPKTYKALEKIFESASKENSFNINERTLNREFAKMEATSIDYGILEKEKNALLVPATFDWADVGHWRTVHEILRGAPDENVVRGKHVNFDSHGNLIYSTSDRLIATVGVRDMVIIETKDAILICPRERSQDVKKLTEAMKNTKFKKHL